MAALEEALRTTWLTPAPGGVRIGRFVPEGAKIRFGDLVFSQESLLAAMPAPEFFLLDDGWRVAPFRSFRPVVYTCAFGPSPDADLLDWCLARYRIESCEAFSGAAPLLYLDADIMCDRPLTGLLAQLRLSDRVNATPEGRLGEGGRKTDGRWFGWRLLEADGVAFDPDAPGFSAGALGVPAQDFARAAYRCILDGTYGHADQTGRRLPPFDQAMARYVLRKCGLLGLDVMPRYLRLCRVDGPAPAPAPAAAAGAMGLVHFTGGDFAQKFSAMRAYARHLGIME